jgi:hypothetical protein
MIVYMMDYVKGFDTDSSPVGGIVGARLRVFCGRAPCGWCCLG